MIFEVEGVRYQLSFTANELYGLDVEYILLPDGRACKVPG